MITLLIRIDITGWLQEPYTASQPRPAPTNWLQLPHRPEPKPTRQPSGQGSELPAASARGEEAETTETAPGEQSGAEPQHGRAYDAHFIARLFEQGWRRRVTPWGSIWERHDSGESAGNLGRDA